MKIHLLKKVTFFYKNAWIDTFHYHMFHGHAVRTKRDPWGAYFLDDELTHPVTLYLNTFRSNHVFQPNLNLIVSENVRDCCSGVGTFKFLEARVAGTCQIPYNEGNFSHWDDPDYQDDGERPQKMLLQSARRSKNLSSHSRYFEWITAWLKDFPVTADDPKVQFEFPSIRERGELVLPRQALEDFRIGYLNRMYAIEDSLFRSLSDYLNFHYFVRSEHDVG
jgi:hypothetical protein